MASGILGLVWRLEARRPVAPSVCGRAVHWRIDRGEALIAVKPLRSNLAIKHVARQRSSRCPGYRMRVRDLPQHLPRRPLPHGDPRTSRPSAPGAARS